MTDIGEDNRQFSRIPFQSKVEISNNVGTWHSNLIDVSLRGVLVSFPEGWVGQVDDPFSLELILENSDITIRMEGSVAHNSDSQVGFRCEHIDLDSITHLRRLVELNVGNSDILDRELSAMTG